jgi:hypothetical protein
MSDINIFSDEYTKPTAVLGGDIFDINGAYGQDTSCKSRIPLLTGALAVVVVLIIVVLYYMWSPCMLAKDLAHCDWIVYYRQGCGYCTKQKHVLSGKFHKYIECDTSGRQIGGYTSNPPLACDSPIITGFPFWYNTRTQKTRAGLQDIGELRKMVRHHR